MNKEKLIRTLNIDIDELIQITTDEEYDGSSEYYFHFGQIMPECINSIRSCISLLLRSEVITEKEALQFVEKVNNISY